MSPNQTYQCLELKITFITQYKCTFAFLCVMYNNTMLHYTYIISIYIYIAYIYKYFYIIWMQCLCLFVLVVKNGCHKTKVFGKNQYFIDWPALFPSDTLRKYNYCKWSKNTDKFPHPISDSTTLLLLPSFTSMNIHINKCGVHPKLRTPRPVSVPLMPTDDNEQLSCMS